MANDNLRYMLQSGREVIIQPGISGTALIQESPIQEPYKPYNLGRKKSRRTIVYRLFRPQRPVLLERNLLRVFKGTVHHMYAAELVSAMKYRWICLNLADFEWEEAISWLKVNVQLADEHKIGTFDQVVLANVKDLSTPLLVKAQTDFGLVGAHFYPYKEKSFEAAAKELDDDIQEGIDDYAEEQTNEYVNAQAE